MILSNKLLNQNPSPHGFRWVVAAFLAAIVLTSALLGWQLFETTPARWCSLAVVGSPESASGCVSVLLRLLDIKDHTVIGLLVIVGLSVLSLAAVALGVRINATGPGGFSTEIGADKTKITDGENTTIIPTPPAGDSQ